MGAQKGVPRATKAAQEAPREDQRTRPRDFGRQKVDPRSASEAKKVKFEKSVPRLGPADVSDALDRDSEGLDDPFEALDKR